MQKRCILTFGVLFLILAATLISANEVFVFPASLNVNQSNSFNIEIRGNTFLDISDIYGIEFNVNYNPSLITLNSISEGDLLNNNNQDETIFSYDTAPGSIDIYNIRNSSTGIYNNGSFAIISFTSIASGTASIDINNVIWVNSTITNSSVGIPNVVVNDGSVIINPVDSGGNSGSNGNSGGGGGGGGGGGSGGGSSSSNNQEASSNDNSSNQEFNNFESSGSSESSLSEGPEENFNQEPPEEQGGFLAFTGGIIENITSGEILKSWAFYAVIGVVIVFVLFYFKKRRKKTFDFLYLYKKRRR